MTREMFWYKDLGSAKRQAIKLIEKGYRYIHITGDSRIGYAVWADKE